MGAFLSLLWRVFDPVGFVTRILFFKFRLDANRELNEALDTWPAKQARPLRHFGRPFSKKRIPS